MKKKVILIVGPTAVGKTFTSIEIAKALNTEIISADSMQIYKYMDIGTAKIMENEKNGIKHHLIDMVNPDESFTVADFKNYTIKIISELHNQNKIPVITGGTGLYINSLIYKLNFSNTPSNENVRLMLMNELERYGKEHIYNSLKMVDPVSAGKIHMNNTKRVIRALEVFKITGIPFSSQNTNFKEFSNEYDFIIVGLEMNRELLYNRINQRVDEMILKGLIEEVGGLLNRGYNKELISMQGIGYKEIIKFLNNELSYSESINLLKQNTRHFAKRQFTWFKADSRIKWIDVNSHNKNSLLNELVSYLNERGVNYEANN